MKNILIALSLIIICGCASKDKFYQGVYKGLHNREEVVNPADEPVPPSKASYDEYKRERNEILEENK